MSFIQKPITSSSNRFYYLKAELRSGLPAWYFVLVEPLKETAFKKLDYSKPFKISDFGNIIKSGFGDAAPQEVIEGINLQYKTEFSNS